MCIRDRFHEIPVWNQATKINSDHGIWRRIHAIPFNHTFTAEEQDKELGSKLTKELPGILNWAIKGCLDWQKQGLNPPQTVLEQVSAYKTEMDSFAQFIRDECKLDPDIKYPASKLTRPIAITAKPSAVSLSPPTPSRKPWTN